VAGAISGLLGGWLAEWAFHTVRIQNRLFNWAQLDSNEQLGLAVAEMLLYASLLSFFAAFFSWGASKDNGAPVSKTAAEDVRNQVPLYSPVKDDQPKIDIPLFKKEPESNSSKNPKMPPGKKQA
jgi:hypothetical protein